MRTNGQQVERAYAAAKDRYASLAVDTDKVLEQLRATSISLQCWQGDDVCGFENAGQALGGGLAVTGNYPGKARTADELRQDLDMALRLIPGRHRVNLHAIYAETGGKRVDRTELEPKHFDRWIGWAKERNLGLDFNPTFFAHRLAADGFTLSHADRNVRRFWIQHGIVCRRIGAAIGESLNKACVTNVWIPDGSKDLPIDRRSPRERLREALDEIFAEKLNPLHNFDAVESKLFGIGSESYVVGSHEFYLGYAISNNVLLCLDSGHFHPTESIADKISSVLTWTDQVLLHVSRGVRWDSDHVVILGDELQATMHEIVRGSYLNRTRIALDFFDASISRIAAWVIGTRATLKAMLYGLLEPTQRLRGYETTGDYTSRLALLETLKAMPYGSVWDYYCLTSDVPLEVDWMKEAQQYEANVLCTRR